MLKVCIRVDSLNDFKNELTVSVKTREGLFYSSGVSLYYNNYKVTIPSHLPFFTLGQQDI